MIEKLQAQEATGLEKLVLGAIMSRSGSLEELMQEVKLTPEMFYNLAHQTIFNAILDSKGSYDLWSITQYLIDKGKLEDIGGAVPLAELVKYGSTNGEIIHHAKVIVQKFMARQAWEILQKAIERCQSTDDIADIIDDVKANLTDLIPSDASFFELEKRFRVDFAAEPNPETAILYVRQNDKLIRLFTLSNMSLVSGHAKARKTFLAILIVAAYMGYINDLIVTNDNQQGIVLIFDTEQSPDDLLVMMKKICPMIGDKNPSRIKPYGLKTLTPIEKIKFIDDAIKANPDAVLVIIDGIRDLIYDINSPVESTNIIVRLMKWVAENNIHIVNILHLNKGDENPRGHLGTELQNKVEIELCVVKDRDGIICTVEPRNMRHKEFKPFSFIINDDELPEICDTPEEDKPIKRYEPHFISHEKHYKVLEGVFKEQREQKYKEAWTNIKLGFAEEGIYFGENKAKEYLAYYIREGWVSKDETNKSYKYERAVF